MVKSPPVLIVKILKLPLLALMISEEAPKPVMVTVPAVPAPTVLLASTMLGNAEAKVMVKGLEPEAKLKSIVSLPAVVFARVIASLREPAPVSKSFTTEKVAGTTRSSRLRSSSLRRIPLRVVFLERSRLKILRKKFNDIVREPFNILQIIPKKQSGLIHY